MSSFANTLKALVVSVLTDEPTLVVGVVVSAVVAVLGLVGVVAPVGTIVTVVTVLLGALVTRLQVTPSK